MSKPQHFHPALPPSGISLSLALLALTALLLLSTQPARAQETPDSLTFWSDLPREELLDKLMERMTPEEKLGQCFLLGYATEGMNPDIEDWIRNRNLGGVKVFGWNAQDLTVLQETLTEMQEAAGVNRFRIPLFTATDQEGGWVRHVRGDTSMTPGNMAIAATGMPRDAWKSGYYLGQELRALGINMNFAPTIDVYVNPKAVVIGSRAFSDNALQTGLLAAAYYRGMAQSRVICTAKHFPGHGNADRDSHGSLPEIPSTMKELWRRDLLPYRMLFREGIPAVLSGHLAFPRITDEPEPASLSSFFCQDLLRGRLGFDGLLITDDLTMWGARIPGLNISQTILRALKAGNDLVMISGDIQIQNQAWNYLLRIIREDTEFRSRIDQAARRVLQTKLDYLKPDSRVPLRPASGQNDGDISTPGGKEFFYQHAYRSVTVLRGGKIPVSEGDSVLLAGTFPYFFREGRKIFPESGRFFFDYEPFHLDRPEDRKRLLRAADDYDHIIFNLYSPASMDLLQELKPLAEKVTVLSVLSPVYLEETPWVERAVAAWGLGPASFEAGFAVLRGEYTPPGKNPLSFFQPEGEQP